MIKAPFNFIPLAENAFLPDWASMISHDIPFEDGVSGEIVLKITAESPLFIRNGHTKADKDSASNADKVFSQTPSGEYFIPGSSIKGAIRNVLEVMTFSKMTQVQDKHFGKRDLNDKDYRKKLAQNKVHCGWLQYDGIHYQLEDCGKPNRIDVEKLDEYIASHYHLKTDILGFVKDSENFAKDNGRSAKQKYIKILKAKYEKENDDNLNQMLVDSRDFLLSNEDGTIILSGQPGARIYNPEAIKPIPSNDDIIAYCKKNNLPIPTSKKEFDKYKEEYKNLRKEEKIKGCWQGKGKEFIFPNSDSEPINVDDVIDSFKTIHADSPDYEKVWSKKLANGEKIPVFFVYYEGTHIVHSMGLSFLYKYPYNNSVMDCIPNDLKDGEEFSPDMAECILGHIKGDGLKGRVQFCHSIPKSQSVEAERELALNSPKPSYYPLYKRGKNWDLDSEIAGRKMYHRWERTADRKSDDNSKINSTITPLRANSTFFESKVKFFNLKPEELGALLASVSFLGDNGRTFKHSLGQGKPYGYGICKIEVTGGEIVHEDQPIQLTSEKQVGFMKRFVALMDKNKDVLNFTSWKESEPIKALFAIAGTRKKVEGDVYMKMSIKKEENEFAKAKEKHLYLRPIDTNSVQLPDLDEILNIAQNEQKQKEENERKQKEMKEKETKAKEQMQSLGINTKVTIEYLGKKRAKIISPVTIDTEIQLVIPKYEPEPQVGSKNEAIVAQVSKDGKITQLKLRYYFD